MTKQWADGPYKLIPTPTEAQTKGLSKEVIWVATDMSLAHNILLLNLNSMILQCEQITDPKDIADFIIFCQCAIEEIHTHHDMEEANLFPQIAEYSGEKDVMAANFAQHHAFEAALETLEKYLSTVTPETYDGTRLKSLIEAFAKDLVPHLTDEITTLLGLEKYGGEALGKVFTEFNAKILPSVKDKHRVLPCVLGGIDKSFEGGKHNFPPFPWFVPYLVHYYFARRYRGSWRFAPCTMFGQRRELPFAKDTSEVA